VNEEGSVDSSGSRIEVEVKLRFAGVDEALERLGRLPSVPAEPRRFERNEVYDAPDGSLSREGRLLRLREVDGNGLLTYKEPAPGSRKAKVRAEVESGVTSPESLRAILAKIGFRVVYRYEKYRRYHTWRDEEGQTLAISVDETPIGVFVELEGSQASIDRAARRMGLDDSDYILEDYRSLHKAWLKRQGLPASDLCFDPPGEPR
jgi:adenylate cyclase, class 2